MEESDFTDSFNITKPSEYVLWGKFIIVFVEASLNVIVMLNLANRIEIIILIIMLIGLII